MIGAQSEPSSGTMVLAVTLMFLAFYGLGSILRSGRKHLKALHVANKARLDAKAAAGADAASDARAAAAVDFGGLHFHGGGGEPTGDDEHARRWAGYDHDHDRAVQHDYDRAIESRYDDHDRDPFPTLDDGTVSGIGPRNGHTGRSDRRGADGGGVGSRVRRRPDVVEPS